MLAAMAWLPHRRRTGALVGAALATGVLVASGCSHEPAYCARARQAFDDIDEIDRLAGDPAARGDLAAARARLTAAFSGLGDDAPDELRDDVHTMTDYLAGVSRDGAGGASAPAGDEPPGVRAAGERFAAWLDRNCDPESNRTPRVT
jgi:hypothetical protein